MGLDTSLQFIIGVELSKLCPNGFVRKESKKTKYNEDTGKPYEVDVKEWSFALPNDNEINQDDKYNFNKVYDYFQKLGFNATGVYESGIGIIGLNVGKYESVRGGQTFYILAPDDELIKETTLKVKELFKVNGMETFVDKVQLFAISVASY